MTDTEKAALCARIDELCVEVEQLRKYTQTLESANLDVTARLQDYIGQYDPTDAFVIEIKAENAKLCAEVEALKRDEWSAGFNAGCEAVEAAYEDGKAHYEVENAKLRELLKDMWQFTGAACKKYPRLFDQSAQGGQMVMLNTLDSFEQRMRELGLELG